MSWVDHVHHTGVSRCFWYLGWRKTSALPYLFLYIVQYCIKHTHTLDHSWMMFGSPIAGNPHTDKRPSMDDGSIFQWFNPKCMTSWQELLGSGDFRSSFKNIQKHSRTTSKRLAQNTNHEMPKPSTGTAPYMKRHTAYQASTSPAISHPASRPMCNAWALPIAAACFFEPCGPCFGNVQRQLTGIILAAIESPRHVPVQASWLIFQPWDIPQHNPW